MGRKKNAGAKVFLKAFASSLRTSIPLWLTMLLIGLLLLADIYFLLLNTLPLEFLLWLLLAPLVTVYLFTLSQVFIVEARFSCTFMRALKNALFISLVNPVTTLLHLCLTVLPAIIFLWEPALFFSLSLLWFFFYFSMETYLNAAMVQKSYTRLIAGFQKNAADH